MTKRSPNRRRKSSRKPSPRSHASELQYQDAAYNQAGHQQDRQCNGMLYASELMPAFSEDSIQRQLGGYMVLPPTFAPAQANMWQPGCWYPYTHPATGEEVAEWYDARYVDVEGDYSYGRKQEDGCERFYHQGDCHVRHDDYLFGRKHENGCERFYHQGDCIVRPGHDLPPLDTSVPPLFQYVEGYHDPILKGLAPDWWRLFGHDVPKQFILSPTSVDEPDMGSAPRRSEEKDGEWDAAAYFGPCRASDTEPGRGSVRADGEESAKRRDGREDRENRAEVSTTKKSTEGSKRECRGRDDWECDFCGPECFCWTVKKEKRPVDDIQSPRMRLYKETCLSVGTTTGRS